MEELIKLVAKQAGLSDDVAEKGVGMVRIRLALTGKSAFVLQARSDFRC